jgi:4-hydroxy-tetrahydrodipicolinate reductase
MQSPAPSPQPLRLWIHGLTGRMGEALTKEIRREGASDTYQLLGGSTKDQIIEALSMGKSVTVDSLGHVLSQDHPQVILDFTSITGNEFLLETLSRFPDIKTAVVIGTTGIPTSLMERWTKISSRIPILFAPNTSIGIVQMLRAARHIAKALDDLDFDLEITETHHRFKKDSPSGTAMFLARSLAGYLNLKVNENPSGERHPESIGVHGIRGGMVVGEHEIRFLGMDQEISIKHRAFDRSVFAKGALRLAIWLKKQKHGIYHLEDVAIT